VELYESITCSYQIFINGELVNNAIVSDWVIRNYLKGSDSKYLIKIKHIVDVPIGFGLGTSGAAALSLSYALNQVLHRKLSMERAAQIAHVAEISCKTGLGTVISEFYGGLEIRTGCGAPGIGKLSKIKVKDHNAVILCINPILTKNILSKYSNRANILGRQLIEQLILSRNIEDFLSLSKKFADFIGLTKGVCAKPITKLENIGIRSSVALFGETLFTLIPKEETKKITRILKEFPGLLLVCDIDNRGAVLNSRER
jgi:pantoate kinase